MCEQKLNGVDGKRVKEYYFPVFKRADDLRIEPRRFCEGIGQVVQVRVNGEGKVVSCCLARCGCDVFKGKLAAHDKPCLLGGGLNE